MLATPSAVSAAFLRMGVVVGRRSPLLWAVLSLGLLSSSSAHADATARVAEGKAAFAAGDHRTAYEAFRAAADEDPKHPTALYNAALSARKAGLMQEAAVAYRQILAASPSDLDVVYGLAEVERALANVDAARALYTRYLADEHRPDRADLRTRAQAGLDALPTPPKPSPTPSVERPAALASKGPAIPVVVPVPVPAIPVVIPVIPVAPVGVPAAPVAVPVVAAAPVAPVAPVAPSAPSVPSVPTASPAHRQQAQRLFEEGLALARQEQHGDAAARFVAAATRDPARVDAWLKAGLAFRRAGVLDDAVKAYGRAIDHPGATADQRLDGTYGLAESHRLRGDVDTALSLFTRYIDGETRPAEARFVERARAQVAELTARQLAAATPPAAPTPVPTPTPVAVAVAAPAVPAAPVPAPTVAFDSVLDAAVAGALVAEAERRQGQNDVDGAASRRARARAVAIGGGPDTSPPTAPQPCDADALLAKGEGALQAADPRTAVVAFRRARACDPTRAAPLWGLSRALDALGARQQGKHHAALYVAAKGPDEEPEAARAAFFRSEQP